MAFKILAEETWQRKFRRTLLIGPPNSWKTTALRTWPKPIAVLVYPGEQGSAAIPVEDGVQAFIWEHDPTSRLAPGAVLKAVAETTVEIISGKYGEFQTFAGDGIHKLYDVFYEAAFAELDAAGGDPDKLGGRAFGLAHSKFQKHLHLINQSTVPYVVMTAWSSMERDDPESKVNKNKHVWPDLPGRMGQNVVGEFGSVLYSKPGKETAPGKFSKGQWQTRPFGDVWGVGLKLPLEIAAKVPTYVDQDWQALQKMVEGK